MYLDLMGRQQLRRSFTDAMARRPGIDAESALERAAGLKARYSRSNFRERQLEDPFNGKLVFFPVRAYTENWLLRTFDPDVTARVVPTEPMQALASGQALAVRPALLWSDSEGTKFADFVEQDNALSVQNVERVRAAWGKFQTVVRAHNFVPIYRSREEVQGNQVLIGNLRHWRQHLVNHASCRREAVALMHFVERFIQEPEVQTVGDLYVRVQDDSVATASRVVDCAVIFLYMARKLNLSLEEESYGSDIRVQPV